MAYASTYSVTKAALVKLLSAREGLQRVAVGYDQPAKTDDVRARGTNEAIWFDGAQGVFSNVVLCAGELRFDERMALTLVAQVLRPTSRGTQYVADSRADELFYEVLAELSGQDSWDMADLGLNVFDYFQVTPGDYRRLPMTMDPQGHADRIELDLLVESRRSFP